MIYALLPGGWNGLYGGRTYGLIGLGVVIGGLYMVGLHLGGLGVFPKEGRWPHLWVAGHTLLYLGYLIFSFNVELLLTREPDLNLVSVLPFLGITATALGGFILYEVVREEGAFPRWVRIGYTLPILFPYLLGGLLGLVVMVLVHGRGLWLARKGKKGDA